MNVIPIKQNQSEDPFDPINCAVNAADMPVIKKPKSKIKYPNKRFLLISEDGLYWLFSILENFDQMSIIIQTKLEVDIHKKPLEITSEVREKKLRMTRPQLCRAIQFLENTPLLCEVTRGPKRLPILRLTDAAYSLLRGEI